MRSHPDLHHLHLFSDHLKDFSFTLALKFRFRMKENFKNLDYIIALWRKILLWGLYWSSKPTDHHLSNVYINSPQSSHLTQSTHQSLQLYYFPKNDPELVPTGCLCVSEFVFIWLNTPLFRNNTNVQQKQLYCTLVVHLQWTWDFWCPCGFLLNPAGNTALVIRNPSMHSVQSRYNHLAYVNLSL